MNLSKTLILVLQILLITPLLATSQSVEIQGQARVTNMSNDNSIDDIVVRQPDGTLSTRSAQSLPTSFIDTTRNLTTDLELAKQLCECPNLPPFLIQQLLDQGYEPSDLVNAGVPSTDVIAAMPVIDVDGNEYDKVTIGTQVWLSSNLKTTKYTDGTLIPLAISDSEWGGNFDDEIPARSHPNGNAANFDDYGYIYNVYTLPVFSNKDICPDGYHVATRTDVETLITYLDSDGTNNNNSAGQYLKETGTTYWLAPNATATNATGFSSRGNGSRRNTGTYSSFRSRGYFMTNTPNVLGVAHYIAYPSSTDNELSLIASNVNFASSAIRCVKD